MNQAQWLGIIIGLTGVIMWVFGEILGPKFCKLGKRIIKGTQYEKEFESLYDEREAPKIFRFLGKVNIAQGLFIVFVGFFL